MSHIYIGGLGEQNKVICTLDYFRQEVCAFRKLMGEKTFWAMTADRREAAQKAIGIIYVSLSNLDNSTLSEEDNERAIAIYQSAMDEYNRRETLLLFSGRLNTAYA